MRILFLAPRFHTNQIEIVKYFIDRGHEVEFMVSRRGHIEDYSVLEPIPIAFNSLYTLLKRFFGLGKDDILFDYTWGPPSLTTLLAFTRKRLDVVVIRSPYTCVGLSFALLSRVVGTKVVFYTQRELHQKAQPGKDMVLKLLLKLFKADWITPCLGDLKYPTVSKSMHYIPFCARPVAYEKTWFIGDRVEILCIGKFVARKNHELLINALVPLAAKYRFRLTIIGELSEVTGSEVFSRVMRMEPNLPYPMRVLTNLGRKEVAALYMTSDLFVLPSRDESASVSNLEAMSFGLPVVTSSTNKTSCYSFENGRVFLSDSLEDLTSILDQLLINRNDLVKMGDRSRSLVVENHSAEKVYRFLEDMIFSAR
jgi:glycosyltransferase involved in cell wall biosynthesis